MFLFFFFNDTATTEIYTLCLHDALPISNGRNSAKLRGRDATKHGKAHQARRRVMGGWFPGLPHDAQQLGTPPPPAARSEEHTSELQSRPHLVCRLLLENKKEQRPSTYRR